MEVGVGGCTSATLPVLGRNLRSPALHLAVEVLLLHLRHSHASRLAALRLQALAHLQLEQVRRQLAPLQSQILDAFNCCNVPGMWFKQNAKPVVM